jgi:hypothetical protein
MVYVSPRTFIFVPIGSHAHAAHPSVRYVPLELPCPAGQLQHGQYSVILASAVRQLPFAFGCSVFQVGAFASQSQRCGSTAGIISTAEIKTITITRLSRLIGTFLYVSFKVCWSDPYQTSYAIGFDAAAFDSSSYRTDRDSKRIRCLLCCE